MAGKVTINLSDDNDLLVSSSVIAKVLLVSQMSVSNFAKNGMPKIIGKGNPTYPVRECLLWAIENGKIKLPTNDEDRENLPPDWRDKLASAELKEEKLKVIRLENGSISKMAQIAFQIGDFVKNGILNIPGRISAILAKEDDVHECELIMRNEFMSVMQDMADQIDQLKSEIQEESARER